MRAKHIGDHALALMSGALFLNANPKLRRLFDGEIIFAKDETFATTALENVTWYWKKGENMYKWDNEKMKERLELFFTYAGQSLSSHSFGEDPTKDKNEFVIVINKYKQ